MVDISRVLTVKRRSSNEQWRLQTVLRIPVMFRTLTSPVDWMKVRDSVSDVTGASLCMV